MRVECGYPLAAMTAPCDGEHREGGDASHVQMPGLTPTHQSECST